MTVRILDSTLREGMQAPGVRFTPEQSAEIASGLAALGVDTIECGHPVISAEERERIARVAELGLGVPLLAHARARPEDVQAAAAAGVQWVGIFLGVNGMSQRARVRRAELGPLLDLIREAVVLARCHGLKVRYTLEDSSRTEMEPMLQAYQAALDAGAERICYADTVGLCEPSDLAARIDALRQHFPGVPVEVHLHDDRGLAVANALAAIDAGASWISTSVNGIGERCGITCLSTLLANLHHRGERRLHEPKLLHDLSRRVAAYSRCPVESRAPVVGGNAFRHTAALHLKAIEHDPMAYAWIEPEAVGARNQPGAVRLPVEAARLTVKPPKISATELRHHRHGPGTRYVMIDERFVPDCRQYCIVRDVPELADYGAGHVDRHRHSVDSLFLFLGHGPDLEGLTVEVELAGERLAVHSPASVFIPAGIDHSYRVVGGSGLFVNHVLAGSYNASLIDPLEVPADVREQQSEGSGLGSGRKHVLGAGAQKRAAD